MPHIMRHFFILRPQINQPKMKNKITFLVLLLVLLFQQPLLAQDGSNDPAFNSLDTGYGNGADSYLFASVVQSDGKIIIGGSFERYKNVGRSKIARLNANGSLDLSFNPGEGADDYITSMVLLADGKIIIGGRFTTYNGQTANKIARINADGSLDTTFNTGAGFNNMVMTLAVQPDGKIVAGGGFTSFNGETVSRITRLNADGTKDTSFTVMGVNDSVLAIAIQEDGKILAGGTFTTFNFASKKYMARLNSNGTTDTTFYVALPDYRYIYAIKQNQSGIYIGGSYVLQRLNVNGTLHTDLGVTTGLSSDIYSLQIQPDGKLLAGGAAQWVKESYAAPKQCLIRITTDGEADDSFSSPLIKDDGALNFIALKNDGKIVVGGAFLTYNGNGENYITVLNNDGTKDETFSLGAGTGADNIITQSVLQPDGKIIISGYFTKYNGISRKSLARLNTDGTLDETFIVGTGIEGNYGSNTVIDALLLQQDGKVLVGGFFKTYNGQPVKRLVRLNADGSLDTSFDFTTPYPELSSSISGLALQPDNKVLISGYFRQPNNKYHFLIRLNTDGSFDASFNPANVYRPATKIIIQPDNKMLLALGDMNSSDNPNHSAMRLNSDGSIDTSFAFMPASYIEFCQEMSLQPDGKIIVSGTLNGISDFKMGRLNADGTIDSAFQTSALSNIALTAVQGDGKIIVANIYNYNGQAMTGGLFRLNQNGTIDETFDSGTGIYGTPKGITSIVLLPENKMIIAGAFNAYNGVGRNRIARINVSGSLGIDDHNLKKGQVIVYKQNNMLKINSSKEIASVDVYDIAGRLVSQVKSIKDVNVSIDAVPENNILLVQVKHTDGTKSSKKIYF